MINHYKKIEMTDSGKKRGKCGKRWKRWKRGTSTKLVAATAIAAALFFSMTAASLPPFAVSAGGGAPQMILTTNRLVILDDPSGWDLGSVTPPIKPIGNQWSGESTTIRWYVLLINSTGRGAQGVTISARVMFPNGTVAVTKTGITNNFGIAEFGQDLDRWSIFNGSGSEGTYAITAGATVDGTQVSGSYNFIYDEWGCGSSGSGCHISQFWQPIGVEPVKAGEFGGSFQDSPYLHNFDNIHSNVSGLGKIFIDLKINFGTGECLTCHRGFDGVIRNHDGRVTAEPQFPAGIHFGKVRCVDCHAPFGGANRLNVMPIRQCYDCHSKPPIQKNNNLTTKNFAQTASSGFSFRPLNDPNVAAHNAGQNIPCIICHKGMHNVSKPLATPETSNAITEFQQCLVCHNAYKPHNNSVSCTVCHSQDAHVIKVFAQNATYVTLNAANPNPARGNCTNCHQNPTFFAGILKQPMAGQYAGRLPPQIPKQLNHSNSTSAGRKWNNYWINGTDGAAQLTSCLYCHGRTFHTATALGRPSLFSGKNTVDSAISENTNWCPSCHMQGYVSGDKSYTDTVRTFNFPGELLVPPENTGNTSFGNLTNASDGTAYFNHLGVPRNDLTCRGCHGRLVTGNSITGFVHNVSVGVRGGPDCALCHDTGGSAPKTINFSIFKQSVHRNLNNKAVNSTPLSDTVDKACWACHSDGTQPTSGSMGTRFRTPRKCFDNECHALTQSFKEPMLYSHFKDADLINNPSNARSFNISTKASCVVCHSNSLNAQSDNLNASVSHFGSRKNLIDSMNCIYCHLDEDNASKWGNAIEINKNRTGLIEMDRERNKFTVRKGEFVDLGQGYRIRINDIVRESAAFELYKVDKLIDSGLINVGRYEYAENITIKNASSRTSLIVLNVTGIFLKDNGSFIQFEGFRARRLHRENRTTSCYKCHFRGEAEKHKFRVIDRRNDYLYYSEVLFDSSDRKEYDQEYALGIIANATPKNAYIDIERAKRKTLKGKEKWELSRGYSLTLEEIAQKSDTAQFSFEAGGRSYTDVAKRGEVIDFEINTNYLGNQPLNISIFRARVSDIQNGKPGIAVLEDILALSPDIKKIKENATIFGYNTSWLWENNSFITGRIPSNFHSPQLYDGRDGGPDCTTCHTKDLGIHKGLNKAASGSVSGAKPCWGCHGNGNEPKWHPATYRTPRKCKSCHVERKEPFFNATYVGDEKHGTQEDCTPCHVTNTHTIRKSNVTPGIMDINISKNEVSEGETVIINARAGAGHMMRLRAAEYFIDSSDKAYPLYPIDGSFDDQMEEFSFEINTTGMKPGKHLIYVRAMERNNKWGDPVPISLVVRGKDDLGIQIFGIRLSAISLVFISIFITLTLYISKKKLSPSK